MEQMKLLGQENLDREDLKKEDLNKEVSKHISLNNIDQENIGQENLKQENTDQEDLDQVSFDHSDREILDQENIDQGTLSNKVPHRKSVNADKKTSNKKRWFWVAGFCALTAAVIVTGLRVLRKEIKINPIVAEGYEVHGVDVSHYQGTIDWDVLSQDLDFAFIKATEGSTHVDDRFQYNWQAAEQTHLYLGAYHFFSFDSEGHRQAASYIDTVGSLNGKLAPVVDVEYYGDKRSNPPGRSEVIENLRSMLDTLEQHYEIKPIIYTTYTVYNDYIKGEFEEYPLWVRSVYCPPSVLFGNKWSFWQYMDTAMLDGYAGDQKYIDVNVFKGTKQDLEKLMIQKIMY